MAIGGVVINFTAKTADAVRNVNKLTRELGDVDGKTKGAAGRMKTFAKVGVGALAAGAGAAATALLNMAEMAAEDRTQQLKLESVIRKTTDATEEQIAAVGAWIDDMELATEVADTELREALGRLVSATGDVTQAQELLALAVDTSVARGESLDTVVRALEKAVAGNTNALKRQMPWLDANNDGTLTLKEATEGLAAAYGGAAEEASKANGPMQELAIQWERMQEALGEALLPSLDQLATWLQSPEGQEAVEGWIDATRDFAQGIATLGDYADDTSAALGRLFGPLIKAWNSLPDWLKKWIRGGGTLVPGYGNVRNLPTNTYDSRTSSRTVTGRDGALSSGRVTINNYYPKPEAASVTIARDLRIARNTGGY